MTKIATSIEQSEILKDILPLESADMGWYYSKNQNAGRHQMWLGTKAENADLPAWSLAALLDALPKGEDVDADLCFGGYKGNEYINEWFCSYEVYDNHDIDIQITHADNPVDACYEMILRLNKENYG